jgi:hypothetical protein
MIVGSAEKHSNQSEYHTDTGVCNCGFGALLPREHIRLPLKLVVIKGFVTCLKPVETLGRNCLVLRFGMELLSELLEAMMAMPVTRRSTHSILPKITHYQEVFTCYCLCPVPGFTESNANSHLATDPYLLASI